MSALNTLKKYLKSRGQEINDEWYVKIETRKSGKSAGMTDNYYFSPEGKRFRSMIEVYRFLTTGDKFERDEKTKCLKIDKENNDEIMDDLCELVSDMYINDNIKNLHDTNSGMFRVSSDVVGIAAAGNSRFTVKGNGIKAVNGSLGVNTDPNSTDGMIHATNDIVAFSSDKRLKENIRPIENALDKIDKLSGFVYNWNEKANKEAGYDMDKDYVGVFAQDVEKVQPEAVELAPFDNDSDDNSISGKNYLTVQYEKLVPLLIESIKELKKEIEELKK